MVDDDGWLTGSQEKWKKGKEIEERQYRSKHAHTYSHIHIIAEAAVLREAIVVLFCIIVKGGGKKRDD